MKRSSRCIVTSLALALCGPAVMAQTDATLSQPIQNSSSTDQPLPNGASEVRIVRLSQARGEVQIDRDAGAGFEPAIANLPITRGAKLKTINGVIEVEFEDNSTLRLTPDTEVEFPQLSRNATGTTASTVKILRGMVYVSLAKTKGNTFNVICDRGKLILSPSSHIRLIVNGPETNLAVLGGEAEFESASGTTVVTKHKGLFFTAANPSTPTLLSYNEENPFDAWDQIQSDFYKSHRNPSALAGSGMLYGLADLNYYGSFSNVDGCGRVWRPYFTSAAWDPYANGFWAWYPATGYTWVSVYPWGWAPFHYGSWLQCSNGGWGWQPGGTWSGLRNTSRPIHFHDPDHRHHPHPPVRPPIPPPTGHPKLIAVNTAPLAFSKFNPGTSTFDFHKDSAGLGVPREAFGKLGRTSANVERHGFVHIPVEPLSPPERNDQAARTYAPDHNGGQNRNGNVPDRNSGQTHNSSTYSPSPAWHTNQGANGGTPGPSQTHQPSQSGSNNGLSGGGRGPSGDGGGRGSYSPPSAPSRSYSPPAPAPPSPPPSMPSPAPSPAPASGHK